jgi:hypothetical protein
MPSRDFPTGREDFQGSTRENTHRVEALYKGHPENQGDLFNKSPTKAWDADRPGPAKRAGKRMDFRKNLTLRRFMHKIVYESVRSRIPRRAAPIYPMHMLLKTRLRRTKPYGLFIIEGPRLVFNK